MATVWFCVLLIAYSNFVSSFASINNERDPILIQHGASDNGDSVRALPQKGVHIINEGRPVYHDFVQKRRPILHEWLERRPSIHHVVEEKPVLHHFIVPRAPLHYYVTERQIHHLAPFIRSRLKAPRYYHHVPKRESISRLKRLIEYGKTHPSKKETVAKMKEVIKEVRQ